MLRESARRIGSQESRDLNLEGSDIGNEKQSKSTNQLCSRREECILT
jgi:hypothetical protein